MKLTLTNTSQASVPVMSEDEGGWAVSLVSGTPQTIDRSGSDVWIIGEKPGVLESIEKGVKAMAAMVAALLQKWKKEKPEQITSPTGGPVPVVEVSMTNEGTKPVRVIPGDPTKEVNVNPGDNLDVVAPGYIELRELGG